jgi:hypothetical protein
MFSRSWMEAALSNLSHLIGGQTDWKRQWRGRLCDKKWYTQIRIMVDIMCTMILLRWHACLSATKQTSNQRHIFARKSLTKPLSWPNPFSRNYLHCLGPIWCSLLFNLLQIKQKLCQEAGLCSSLSMSQIQEQTVKSKNELSKQNLFFANFFKNQSLHNHTLCQTGP